MTAFEGWTSPAGQIGNDAFPPTAAIRGSSRSSTALDPQTDPSPTLMTAPPGEPLRWQADVRTGLLDIEPNASEQCEAVVG
jgi:hypothetical protein